MTILLVVKGNQHDAELALFYRKIEAKFATNSNFNETHWFCNDSDESKIIQWFCEKETDQNDNNVPGSLLFYNKMSEVEPVFTTDYFLALIERNDAVVEDKKVCSLLGITPGSVENLNLINYVLAIRNNQINRMMDRLGYPMEAKEEVLDK